MSGSEVLFTVALGLSSSWPWQRAARRLARLSEQVLPAPLAMHAIAAVERRWGEPHLAVLPDLVRRDGIAVDIGAAEGVYTHFLAGLAREVHAFEPNPDSAARVRRRVPQAVVHACALGDAKGETELRIPVVDGQPLTGWASVEPKNAFGALPAHEVQRVRVPQRTLDSFGLVGVGFVKIDVEGHESAVLRGAQATLERDRPVLLVEAEDRHRPGAVKEVFEMLEGLGYRASDDVTSTNNYLFRHIAPERGST